MCDCSTVIRARAKSSCASELNPDAYNRRMNPSDEAIRSGARQVNESEELAHGYSAQKDESVVEVAPEEPVGEPVKTALANLTLSMFEQGASTRVRVGNPHNASELYELAFDSADAANSAMLDAGILTADQVPDTSKPAGTGIALGAVTLEQLEAAGLKRHNAYTG